jgi:transposase-like protein
MGRKSTSGESYKREAVAKAEASGNVSQAARELGISNKSLRDWIRRYGSPSDIEAFYNRQRLHSGIDYARPVSRAA